MDRKKDDGRLHDIYVQMMNTDMYAQTMKTDPAYLHKQSDGQLVWHIRNGDLYMGVVNSFDEEIGRIDR